MELCVSYCELKVSIHHDVSMTTVVHLHRQSSLTQVTCTSSPQDVTGVGLVTVYIDSDVITNTVLESPLNTQTTLITIQCLLLGPYLCKS